MQNDDDGRVEKKARRKDGLEWVLWPLLLSEGTGHGVGLEAPTMAV